MKFHRIIFCGSVIPYNFRFEQIQDQFSAPIINEVGTRDIWPAMAESITRGYGSAGTYNFRRPLVRDRWHNGAGHGYFLSSEFCSKYWIPFLRWQSYSGLQRSRVAQSLATGPLNFKDKIYFACLCERAVLGFCRTH